MAFSVMLYHYISWGWGGLSSDSILGRLGIYAVSTFYVLSGVSLALVYSGRIQWGVDFLDFFVKRFFRIFPLFWFATTAAILLKVILGRASGTDLDFSWSQVLLNYSLLFGFIDPSLALTVGGWSIGNEVFFYFFFPFVMLFSNRYPVVVLVFFIAGLFLAVYYSFFVLMPELGLQAQWQFYVSSLNQLFLFAGGVVVGFYFKSIPPLGIWWLILLGVTGLFCLYPVTGDRINLVVGAERFIFSFSCIVIVLCLLVLNPTVGWGGRALQFLGEASYSVYLLHPLVYMVLSAVLKLLGMGAWERAVVAVISTLVVSWAVYLYLEQPMMRLGRRVSGALAWR